MADKTPENKEGLTFEEKSAMVEKATEQAAPTMGPDDDKIFNPEPVKVQLGGKDYELRPLKLSQMRYLIRLSKINLTKFDEEQLQIVVDCVSVILKEPDKQFVEDNLDIPTMTQLFSDIERLNYAGIPKPKPGDKVKAGN